MRAMSTGKFSDMQVIGFSRQAGALIPIKEIWRKHGFSDACLDKWRFKCGGMDAFQVIGRQPHERFVVPTQPMIFLIFKL